VTQLDGRPLAAAIGAQTEAEIAALSARGVTPTLAALVATSDPATAWYVNSIATQAARRGITLREVTVADDDADAVLETLEALSRDDTVDAIICLTPLPARLTLARAGERIAPEKDVDGANPLSLGRLAAGLPAFAPATAQAVLELLHAHGIVLSGAETTIVGRSTVVGKPLALLLLAEHATVTVCHSRTRALAEVTSRAEVLVAAAGQPALIGAAHVRPGAIVIDVGTNVTEDGGLVGDVDTGAVEGRAGAVTPVPGGVGPVTTAVLLRNVAAAAAARRG
jgi:methylenetetrahydrofolate dehydrogenase (NADP+)/methenyltetrahydrofolate cyclohydrolase